mgnify:CR=1 FL=1
MIEASNLSKAYSGVQALKQVSFGVDRGEIFGFIGPDGAGKTTLFRILTTLLLSDVGEARLDGYDVIRDFRRVRQIVGYMPGQFSLYSDLSVEENLNFFATVFGTTIRENYHLIRDIYIQIEPFKKRLAGRLSGGMKQKLALSCALIHQPAILILDEPTTGVDAVSRREFWDLLMGLKKKGITILVSTPYMDEAGLCDRVALIQKGRILALDRPGSIVKQFNRELFSVRSGSLYNMLKELRKEESTQSVYPFGRDLHYSSNTKDFGQQQIEELLLAKGYSDVQVGKIFPGIEDVFMSLMEEKGTRMDAVKPQNN